MIRKIICALRATISSSTISNPAKLLRTAVTCCATVSAMQGIYRAQDTSDIAAGNQPGISFSGSDIDAINLANGMLNVHIPLLSFPQRGGKLRLDFSFRARGKRTLLYIPGNPSLGTDPTTTWTALHNSTDFGGLSGLTDDQDVTMTGVTHTYQRPYPQQGSLTDNQAVWSTSDGATHAGYQVSGTSYQMAIDGTGFKYPLTYSGTCASSCYTTDGDGVSYRLSSSVIREDKNGNKITGTYSNSSYPNNSAIVSYSDTMGRSIPAKPTTTTDLSYCPSGTTAAASWTVAGYGGVPLTYKFCYAPQTQTLTDSCGAVDQLTSTTQVNMLTAIILPNFLSWQFSYGGAGATFPSATGNPNTVLPLLTKLTYPTGGTISYTYQCYATAGTFVATRTENPDPQQSSSQNHVWTYSYNVGSWKTSSQTTATDPQGQYVVHTLAQSTTTVPALETYTKYYTASSALLRTIETTFANTSNHADCSASQIANEVNSTYQPTCRITTLDNGHVSKVAFAYCCDLTFTTPSAPNWGALTSGTYGLPADGKFYDFANGGAGALLKELQASYSFASNGSYLSANLLHLPASTSTLDATGNVQASTLFTYDETSYLQSYPNDSSISGSHDSLSGVHGSLTTVATWNKGQNPAYIYTHAYVYDTGEISQAVDGRSNSTSYSYDRGISALFRRR
ncbi:hypothetical protein DYQ86_09605 [Acidobacteria bacterium AB60]|nr:hypothetical protein DYQ86_09605 [Acidobacteria bacterium AB60]